LGRYATLPDRGYRHLPVAARRDPSPINAFRSLLGISGQAVAPTYDGLYTA
jgi:hypothetical protein